MTGHSGEIDSSLRKVIASMDDLELESVFFNSLNDEQRRRIAEINAYARSKTRDEDDRHEATVPGIDSLSETTESLEASFFEAVKRQQTGDTGLLTSFSEEQDAMLEEMALRHIGELGRSNHES